MSKSLRVALLGYGTVGRSVHKILANLPGIEVVAILRRPGKAQGELMTDSFESILNDTSVDCLVDVLPGAHPSYEYIQAGLNAKKTVVTANKAAVALDLPGLSALAQKNGVQFFYEATCGGGVPVIHNLCRTVEVDDIKRVKGILNGTCNFILDVMETQGRDFADVLKEAQALGYAEADPTTDISGEDVRNKAIIASSIAYQTSVVKDFPVSGLVGLSAEVLENLRAEGATCRLMLLSKKEGDAYALGVAPLKVSQSSLFANVRQNFNAVELDSEYLGRFQLTGQGAGGDPTALAVVQDCVSVAKSLPLGTPRFDRTLTYTPTLLMGNAYFVDEVLRDVSLEEATKEAQKRQAFFVWEEASDAAMKTWWL